MFSNYRRNFFIVLIIAIFLLFTDTSIENSARLWFVGTFGLDIGGATNLTDYLSILQNAVANQVYNLANYVTLNSSGSSGIMYIIWTILGFIISILKIIVSNIYFFYIALAALVYFVLTSRLFKNHYDY